MCYTNILSMGESPYSGPEKFECDTNTLNYDSGSYNINELGPTTFCVILLKGGGYFSLSL